MNSLKIPENGVMLKGSAGRDVASLPPQAFAISLNDSVIEGMIKCVQNGGDIQLALGARPTFHFDSRTHRIPQTSESNPYDLYLTKPYESTREAYKLPLTMGIFSKPNRFTEAAKAATKIRVEKTAPPTKAPAAKPKSNATQSSNNSSSSNLDSDIEALQNGLAKHDAAKGRSVMVNGLPPSRKGANKAKPTFFNTNSNGNGNRNRSMSTSPAPKHMGSPSPHPLSATEQSLERAKLLRKMLVHELAVRDQSTSYLEKKWEGAAEEFRPVLDKVANIDSNTQKRALALKWWKELDPYMYNYDSDDDRQQAIDNAIRQFDKQRISTSDPLWQKLLPKDQRNKNICLSRLQDKLAKAPAPLPPKIKLQRAEDSSSSKDDADTHSDKVKSGGEAMSRSSSNPLPKTKKLSGKEAQAKRLLGNSKSKSTTTTKISPTKPKSITTSSTTAASATKAGNSKVLSQEYIYDSDSSDADAPPASSKPKPAEVKTKPKPITKPAPKPVEKSIVAKSIVANPKPSRDPQPKSAAKRPREDEDSSSSSGIPLSKRHKAKAPLPSQPVKSRPAETRQVPRDVPKNKSTSPAKSSPLASSPPTNASDLSEDDRPMPSRPPVSKKRRAEDVAAAPAAKRKAVSAEMVTKATNFKVAYTKYEALHHEMAALDNPPRDKLANLNNMREQLQSMKAEIYRQHESLSRR